MPKWEPGQSGNPAGRPPGAKNFTTKVREALEKIADGKDYTYEEAFIKSILKKGIVDGDSTIQKLIWNYLDGMPKQSHDVDLSGSVAHQITGMKILNDATRVQDEEPKTATSGELLDR